MRIDLTDNDAERLTSRPTPEKTRLCTKLQIAHGRLMLTVLGGLAEFERELIRARTGEGRSFRSASRRAISSSAATLLSSKIFSMSSSAAAGLSWFVCMRMVCSIVESAVARISDSRPVSLEAIVVWIWQGHGQDVPFAFEGLIEEPCLP
jgi:hypothetical protein